MYFIHKKRVKFNEDFKYIFKKFKKKFETPSGVLHLRHFTQMFS